MDNKIKIKSARKAVEVAKSLVMDFDKEYLIGLYLAPDDSLKKVEIIGIGTLFFVATMIREIYKPAFRHSVGSLMILHNHPCSSVEPTKADIRLTKRIDKAGKILEIPLLDHIIFGRGKDYYSFRENKKL
jgi:DNA repair protein RadC